MPIDLAQNRTINFKANGHDYSLTLAQIGKAQWLTYFSAIEHTAERVKGDLVETYNANTARVQLVTDALVGASGYKVPGGGDLKGLPDWKQKVPVAHRLAAGNAITSVERSPADGTEELTLGFDVVRLDAMWPTQSGEMQKVCGLRHAFGTPTLEQQSRYNRDIARSKTVGGSRTGKTFYMGAQATLIALYDELITAVAGYAFDGTPLDYDAPDHELIIRHMDCFHKVAAAEALFGAAQPELKEAE